MAAKRTLISEAFWNHDPNSEEVREWLKQQSVHQLTNNQASQSKGASLFASFPFFLGYFLFFGLDDLTWCLQHPGSFMHVVFPTPGMMKNGKEMSWELHQH